MSRAGAHRSVVGSRRHRPGRGARACWPAGIDVVVVDDHPSDDASRREQIARRGAASRRPSTRTSRRRSRRRRRARAQPGRARRAIRCSTPPAAAGGAGASEFDLAAPWDDRPFVADHRHQRQDHRHHAGHRDARGVGRQRGRRRQHRRPAGRGHRRSRRRGVRRRGVVVPPRPHPTLPPRRSATWLNFAPDHLDVHRSLAAYERGQGPDLGRPQRADGLAVANADDPVVMAQSQPTRSRRDLRRPGPGADYRRRATADCVGPTATAIVERRRAAPVAAPRRAPTRSAAAATALSARRDARRGPRRAARLRRPPPPGRARRRGRRRALVRRLQGHRPARHAGRGRRLRVGGAHRRRPQQGSRPRAAWPSRAATSGPSWPSARPPDEIEAAFEGRSVDGRVGSRRGMARRVVVAAAPAGPSPATSCCCRRAARRSTGTAPTASAATTSPPRYAPCDRAREVDVVSDHRRARTRTPCAAPAAGHVGTATAVRDSDPPRSTAPDGPRSRIRRLRRPNRSAARSSLSSGCSPGGDPQPGRPGDGAVGVVGHVARRVRVALVPVRAPGACGSSSARWPCSSRCGSTTTGGGAWRRLVPRRSRRCSGRWCSCPASASSVNGAPRWLGSGQLRSSPRSSPSWPCSCSSPTCWPGGPTRTHDWRLTLTPVMVVFVVVRGLLMLQPNLGTTIILAAIVFVMLFVAGVSGKPLGRHRRRPVVAAAACSPSSSRTGSGASWRSSTRGPTR